MKAKYKYRYKTEKELYNKFGEYWEEEVDMNDEGHMDYLLGIEVVVPKKAMNKNGDVIRHFTIISENPSLPYQRTWSICPNLIHKEKIQPSYMLTKKDRRKRFIYE